MPAKVEILIQVCINGRPIWRKARVIRAELSRLMSDKEYDKVIDAAVMRLASESDAHEKRTKEAEKEKAKAE